MKLKYNPCPVCNNDYAFFRWKGIVTCLQCGHEGVVHEPKSIPVVEWNEAEELEKCTICQKDVPYVELYACDYCSKTVCGDCYEYGGPLGGAVVCKMCLPKSKLVDSSKEGRLEREVVGLRGRIRGCDRVVLSLRKELEALREEVDEWDHLVSMILKREAPFIELWRKRYGKPLTTPDAGDFTKFLLDEVRRLVLCLHGIHSDMGYAIYGSPSDGENQAQAMVRAKDSSAEAIKEYNIPSLLDMEWPEG